MANQNIAHHNPRTGTVYSGSNLERLEQSAQDKGFKDHGWLTFTQLNELGATLKTGSKATGLQMFPNGTMKWFRVFNLEQIEGLPEEILKAKPSAATKKAVTKRVTAKAAAKKELEKLVLEAFQKNMSSLIEDIQKELNK